MLFHSWLQNFRSALASGRRHHRRPRRSATFRPRLEMLEDRAVPSGFQQINLVGNQSGMAHFTDSNLNGWGMAGMPDGSFVVANAFTTGLATFYDRSGHVLPQTITVPVEAAESGVLAEVTGQPISTQYGHPTGVVYNSTSDFKISENGVTAPATLIFDTLDGIICGWNPVVDPTHAIVLYDSLADSGAPAVYTSLDIGQSGGQNVLYATDFLNNQLDIIGPQQNADYTLTNFTNIDCTGKGVSHDLNSSVTTDPFSWAWSVSVVNDQLIVTFADLFGPTAGGKVGGGAVDVFNTDGGFLYQIDANNPTSNDAATATGRLENPWGVTVAPANYGIYSNDLLVGNVWGPGHINAYDPNTGAYLGELLQPDGTPIAIKGLWDLEFGDGTPDSGKTNQLFFDAGPNHPGDSGGGLFGVIHAAGDQGQGEAVGNQVSASLSAGDRGWNPGSSSPTGAYGDWLAASDAGTQPMTTGDGSAAGTTGGSTGDGSGSTGDSTGADDTALISWPQVSGQPTGLMDALSSVLKKIDDTSSGVAQNQK